MAVSQSPVLLCGVEQKAQDEEGEAELLEAGSFVGTDEDAALELRIGQHHNLRKEGSQTQIWAHHVSDLISLTQPRPFFTQ